MLIIPQIYFGVLTYWQIEMVHTSFISYYKILLIDLYEKLQVHVNRSYWAALKTAQTVPQYAMQVRFFA